MNRTLFWLALLPLVVLRFRDAWVYPPFRGWDANGHCVNLLIMAKEVRWPLPWETWASYHPPFYYFVACLPAWLAGSADTHLILTAGKMLSACCSLGSLALLYSLLKRRTVASWGVVLAALTPAGIFTSCMVYNLEAAGFLYLLCLWMLDRGALESLSGSLRLGVGLGLAALTRMDACAAYVSSALWPKAARHPMRLLLAFAIGGAIFSPYLLRNLAVLGRLVAANTDPDLYPYNFHPVGADTLYQPGFFCPSAWLIPSFELLAQPGYPHGSGSWLGLMHALTWTDYLWTMPPTSSFAFERTMMLAAFVPIGLMLRGAYSLGSERAWLCTLAGPLVFFLILNLRLPFQASVKPIYLYALAFPLAWAGAAGAAKLGPRPALAVQAVLVLMAWALLVRYWI